MFRSRGRFPREESIAGLAAALVALLSCGCVSVSPAERGRIEELRSRAPDGDPYPSDFSPPADPGLAAGLNLLPGVGNFYLASGAGGRPDHWLWGAANFLLWPISIAWAVPEGYVDAGRINDLALLSYLDARRDSGPPAEREASAPKPRAGRDRPAEPSDRPLYEIVGIDPADDGTYVVRAKVGDKSKLFLVLRQVKPDVERLIRDEFGMRNGSVPPERIQCYIQPRLEADGEFLVLKGWAFAVQPVADGWEYDPESRRGTLRLRISDGMSPEDAKRWARENVSAIVTDKNVALEAGGAPPSGATYRSLSESFSNGILTLAFEGVE